MTVHGLTQKMTAMAAREAALGAGGVVEYVTAGRLRDADLRAHRRGRAQPDPARRRRRGRRLRDRPLQRRAPRRARVAARSSSTAATRSSRDEARELLEGAGFRVRVTANVYPGVDELDIVPARAVIHDAFEEHITHAPGMERIGEFVTRPHPAHARRRPHRRRAARRGGRRPRRRRRGRRDHRRALGHRRQPRDRGDRDRAASRTASAPSRATSARS